MTWKTCRMIILVACCISTVWSFYQGFVFWGIFAAICVVTLLYETFTNDKLLWWYKRNVVDKVGGKK